MTSPRPLLSIVCPCFDEEAVIGLFHERLAAAVDALENLDAEVVYVDDGSSDGTLAKLNALAESDERVRVCSFSRNFGHQIALSAGLDHAVGDAVLMMDSDLQHPPELIGELVAKWREGYDIVSTVRTETADAGFAKRVSSDLFYSVWNFLSRTPLPRGAADFCLISARVADVVRGMREHHRFLRGILSWTGYTRAIIPYRADERAAGQSKYTAVKMFAMASDAILSFSSAPLRLATRVGAGITALGFLYFLWILGRNLVLGDLVPGWASLIGVTLILGGVQILFIGLIGQYLARVFEEVKGRPMYVLKQAPPKSTRPGRGDPPSSNRRVE